MNKKKYFRARDRGDHLMALREQTASRGGFPGFDCLWDIFSLKRGYPLFIAGSPGAGKTEFTLELAIFTATNYGWRWFVNLGETGTVDEQIAELAYKIVGKPYRKKDGDKDSIYAMTDAEAMNAHNIIDEYFVFCDVENPESSISSLSIKQFYELADAAEREFDIKFTGTIFDPFNDADEHLESYGGREDKYLKDVLRLSRISAKKNDRIDILVNHIADIKWQMDKESGKRFTPPALPSEWAGGRTWHRRAFTMLLVYRPPIFLKNEHGEPYKPNETVIYNQKAKPKGSGKTGHCSLFWDWRRNRYYEDYHTGIYAHLRGEGKGIAEIEMKVMPLVETKKTKEKHEDYVAPF